jgi:hypothetical protein
MHRRQTKYTTCFYFADARDSFNLLVSAGSTLCVLSGCKFLPLFKEAVFLGLSCSAFTPKFILWEYFML